MKKKLIRLTEGDLHRIVEECVRRIVTESQNGVINEGFGNKLKAAAIGGMLAMSPMQANAQQPQRNDTVQTVRQEITTKQLRKLFPQAYKDRNAGPDVWKKNQTQYVAEVNGKICLVGKIAASHGENPWNALLRKYCPQSDEHIFQLGDFDI